MNSDLSCPSEARRDSAVARRAAIVIGNGPSTKLLDFDALRPGHIASVGMNAAYRHWDRIDFRPTHYICMDTVVILAHAQRIAELVAEGRIEKFLLRDELKERHPELAGDPRILWFSRMQQDELPFMRSHLVTTGSCAVRWMLQEGMQQIATIGIDTNYVETLAVARRLGEGSDLRLRIEQTPGFNPNYYFGDYQQKGDVYNVPNSPTYSERTGRLVHVDALRRIPDDARKLGSSARIVDCSPLSGHAAFPKESLAHWLGRLRLGLVTSFHAKDSPQRLADNVAIAVRNGANPFIGSVDVLFEGSWADCRAALPAPLLAQADRLEADGRLRWLPIQGRPNYRDLLEHANTMDAAQVVVANSDIVIDAATAQRLLLDRAAKGNPVLALTRWNHTDDGAFLQGVSASPPWQQIPLERMRFEEANFLSFDAYVVEPPLRVPEASAGILIGTLGCDTALAAVMKTAGIEVGNPCLRYPTLHVDERPRMHGDTPAQRAQAVARNVEAVRASVLARYRALPLLQAGLERLGSLPAGLFMFGEPHLGKLNVWHALMRVLGATRWSARHAAAALAFRRLEIDAADPARSRDEVLGLLESLRRTSVFVEWVIHGAPAGAHAASCLAPVQELAPAVELLKHFKWQSNVAWDALSDDQRSVYADVQLMLRDVLATRHAPAQPEEGPVFAGARAAEAAKADTVPARASIRTEGEASATPAGYRLPPPFSKSYICGPFRQSVSAGSTLVCRLQFQVDNDCTLRLMLCRDGSTPFEASAIRFQAVPAQAHTVSVTHTFERAHPGARIQIGAEHGEATLIDLDYAFEPQQARP